MKHRSKLTLLFAATFVLNANFNHAFASDDAIVKSLNFHYEKYPASSYSKQTAVVNWNSKEGIERFERTKFKGDFYRLSHHFKPQVNPSACGQAAATIVLAAIYEANNKPFPVIEEWPIAIGDKKYPLQYRLLNESNFFNEATDKILNRKAISMKMTKKDGKFGGGIDIEELQKMLKIHGVKSKLVNVEKFSEKELSSFRELVKKTMNSGKEFLLLNYDHS